MKVARASHQATLLDNGSVLITGGQSSSITGMTIYNSAEVYSASADTFKLLDSAMANARLGHAAVLLNNGTVLIAGGWNSGGDLSSAEIFDPATNSFSSTGSLYATRSWGSAGPAAILLGSGQVLLVGGNNTVAEAELYDPVSGTFTLTGALNINRVDPEATLLSDGRVLITGGYDQNTAEIYDPSTGLFSLLADTMSTPYSRHTATLLDNGRVLIVGGRPAAPDENIANADIFDPSTGTFEPTDSLKTARFDHMAARLPDGRVLVAAGAYDPVGQCGPKALAGAEVYDSSISRVEGLVAYYPFNGNANDESGNGNHGDTTGHAPTLVADRFGKDSSAYSFDGVDDYIIINPMGDFPSTGITASFWMLSSDITHQGTPLSYATSSTENMFLVVDYKNFEINVNNISTDDTGVSANDGTWHNIAVTWRSSDGEVKVYKDGSPSYSDVLSMGASMENDGSLVFGQEQDIVGGGFQSFQAFIGVLDDIRIYNRALSEAEIGSLYHEGGWDQSPATPTGLTAEPGDGQVALTWSPNIEPDFLRYRVYMSTPPFPTTLIDSTNGVLNTTRTISELVNGTTYTFYLSAMDTNLNESALSVGVEAIPGVISTTSNMAIPSEYALHPAYPNPFNPTSTIQYDLPEAAEVSLTIYDLLGREVVRLVEGRIEAGFHKAVWNGRNAWGRETPTGIYIARLVTPVYTKSIKMVLLR